MLCVYIQASFQSHVRVLLGAVWDLHCHCSQGLLTVDRRAKEEVSTPHAHVFNTYLAQLTLTQHAS